MPVYEPVVILKPEVVEIDPEARVDSFVKIEGGQGVKIGRWVHIASFCHINLGGGEVVIEEGAAASSHVVIIGGSNEITGISCSAAAPKDMQVVSRKKTVIGRNAVLFAAAVILRGVTIGEGAVIGAGAVVRQDVPPFEVWAGVPARKVGVRTPNPGHRGEEPLTPALPPISGEGGKAKYRTRQAASLRGGEFGQSL